MAAGTPSAGSYGPGAAQKRKNATPAPNGRGDAIAQKRAKLYAARSIPAQPAEAALKDGELDLQAFVAAHEFEIRSLEQSMATSKAVGTSRAFQKVPRGLRRRTASHNPKRVPRRLRARARREMAEDNTPVVEARKRKPRTSRARIRAETSRRLGILAARKRKQRANKAADKVTSDAELEKAALRRTARPKIRRNQLNEPPTPKSKFRRRQINKTWLPTHTWHAKRARMTNPLEPYWRFAIPLTPNEKIYRPTHRAQGDRGAVVWDASYMSTIGLYGNSAGIERVLRKVGVVQESCWNAKGRKWRLGSRAWSGLLSRDKGDSRRVIGPSSVVWNPEPLDKDDNQEPKKKQRQVFFRIHPSAFLELFTELLRLTRMENPRLYIEDLRFEIGSIELTGPASTEMLLSVLASYPNKDSPKTHHSKLFRSLEGLTNSAALPAGAVLGFSVQDPRLQYPPRRLEAPDDPQSQLALLEKVAAWPAEDGLEPFGIFDRDSRYRASCLPTQKSISRRRSTNVPGNSLKPTDVDPPIPVLLLAARSGSGTQTQGSWTLLAPWKCILPIWYSMVHCPLTSGGNPRVGGLHEMRQVAFERGLPWFPADFPGTDAGAEWELGDRRVRQRAWRRRPKSKQKQQPHLGAGRTGEVGDMMASDFEHLVGADESTAEGTATQATQQVENGDEMDVDTQDAVPTKKTRSNVPALKRFNSMSKETFKELINTLSPPRPSSLAAQHALLTVRISLLSRGVVASCARIYRLPGSSNGAPASPSLDAEVPATIPPEPSSPPPSSSSWLPHDLRAQWLARASSVSSPTTNAAANRKSFKPATKPRSLEQRKQQLARELLARPAPYPSPPANQDDMCGHPLVPDAEDLVGFVTSGAFNLSEGRGTAVGSLLVDKVAADVRRDGREGRLCIVRNAGESVGWIARWEAI